MIKSWLSMLFWRLKIIRWMGKLLRVGKVFSPSVDRFEQTSPDVYNALCRDGVGMSSNRVALPSIPIAELADIKTSMKPFVDVSDRYWPKIEDFVASFLQEPEVFEALGLYFNERPYLWNIGLNYSPKSAKQASDSQLWHFDYGDTKTIHYLLYLNDVTTERGPFTHLPKSISERVKRAPIFIERMTDQDVESRLDIDLESNVQRVIGPIGTQVMVDPSRLLHKGSICKEPRLVLFLTFTHTNPMIKISSSSALSNARRRAIYDRYLSSGESKILRKNFFW